jgi:hypothetical protein
MIAQGTVPYLTLHSPPKPSQAELKTRVGSDSVSYLGPEANKAPPPKRQLGRRLLISCPVPALLSGVSGTRREREREREISDYGVWGMCERRGGRMMEGNILKNLMELN